MKFLLKSPFAYFLLGLLLLETGLRVFYDPTARMSDHQLRNSTLLRGWPEYVDRAESKNGVILIGNSQAIGQEYNDVTKIYAHTLAENLAAQDIGFQNWSISGIRIDQIELLVLNAIKHQPRLLVFSLAPSNINNHKTYDFTKDITDLNLTVAEVSNITELPNNFFYAYFDLKDGIIRFFKRYTTLGRSRIELFDQLAKKFSRAYHLTLFGHRRSGLAFINVDKLTGEPSQADVRPMQGRMSAERWAKQFNDQRMPTFKEFHAYLSQRLEEQNIELLWVWMPFSEREDTASLLQGMQIFQHDVCQIIEHANNRCVDLSGLLSKEYFLSANFSSHLSAEGHERYAETLIPLVNNAVH